MPNVIGDVRALAVSKLQAAGLVVHIGMTVDKPICDHVGEAVAQSPSAGTILASGATVFIWVAKPPPGGCF
jgi:beta-lactam-binding protein with PASTA domain